MNGTEYIWDTNIVIYFLQNQLTDDAEYFLDNLLEKSKPAISSITEIELLCWQKADEEDIKAINDFIKYSQIINLNDSVKENTVDVKKANTIKLPDAIIAASAKTYDLTLLTRNIKDFKSIKNLKLLNPFIVQ